jgi:hypothetical protein
MARVDFGIRTRTFGSISCSLPKLALIIVIVTGHCRCHLEVDGFPKSSLIGLEVAVHSIWLPVGVTGRNPPIFAPRLRRKSTKCSVDSAGRLTQLPLNANSQSHFTPLPQRGVDTLRQLHGRLAPAALGFASHSRSYDSDFRMHVRAKIARAAIHIPAKSITGNFSI